MSEGYLHHNSSHFRGVSSCRHHEDARCDSNVRAAQLIIPIVARTQEGSQKLLEAIKGRAFMAEEIAAPLRRYLRLICADTSINHSIRIPLSTHCGKVC